MNFKKNIEKAMQTGEFGKNIKIKTKKGNFLQIPDTFLNHSDFILKCFTIDMKEKTTREWDLSEYSEKVIKLFLMEILGEGSTSKIQEKEHSEEDLFKLILICSQFSFVDLLQALVNRFCLTYVEDNITEKAEILDQFCEFVLQRDDVIVEKNNNCVLKMLRHQSEAKRLKVKGIGLVLNKIFEKYNSGFSYSWKWKTPLESQSFIKLSKNRTSLKTTINKSISWLGNNPISKIGIYHWDIIYYSTRTELDGNIGIGQSELQGSSQYTMDGGWSYTLNLGDGKKYGNYNNYNYCNMKIKNGDIITTILDYTDLANGKLYFSLNGNPLGLAFENITGTVYPMCFFYYKDTQFDIIPKGELPKNWNKKNP